MTIEVSKNYHPIAEHAKTHYMPAITRELLARGYSKLHPPAGAESEPFNILLAKMMKPNGKHAGGRLSAEQHAQREQSKAILAKIPDDRLNEVLGDALGASIRAGRERARAALAKVAAGRQQAAEERAKRNAARVH